MTELRLGAEFPTPDRAEWLAAVEKVLRGKPFDKVLVGATRDGLDIQPLYTAADGRGTAPVPADPTRIAQGWDVRQVHDGDDPEVASAIVGELERGVTSVELTAPAAGWSLERLRRATEGVLLDLAPVALAPDADVEDYLSRQRDYDPDIWIIEVEDREGRHFLDDWLLRDGHAD